ncbi:TonB-dependent receptor [Caulobacter sp. D4A]|uniref:TonB-dependent receptor n=1 Tax=unclassified Caulobacter TaxID=2648921 RepID=UPI000D727A14|nr:MULTISPECIES: TonB-dependent receptor [unclassified Caulobacter]PXA84220.1 TonB-dependent receptor [Caulobacter sp. D4A]PXA95973.1 TonB-dependent receptor [Caulobacter sp. D5]
MHVANTPRVQSTLGIQARFAVLRSVLSCGVAASAIALAASASAQEAVATAPADQPITDNSVDEVVVSAVRQTMQNSIAVKRDTTAIVDALSANEIGDLPGQSIGEAIMTITGATADRGNYGPTEVSLRGLGSFLSATTFNGREASNGSGDRAVNFGQFPSELFNGIKIYKSQQADLIEGGVAGTIEMETKKPLDYGKRLAQVELKGNYNPYQKRITGSDPWGWRGTASYVDQYELGKLGDVGISLGIQRNQVDDPAESYVASNTWVACNPSIVSTGNCTEVSRAQAAAGTPFYLTPNSMTYRQLTAKEKRDAFFGALQWQPNDRFDANFDVEYSKRNYQEDRHDLGLAETRYNLHNVQYDDDGRLLYAEGSSTLQSVSTLFQREEEYIGGGGNFEFEATDRLTLKADISYSQTTRTDLTRSVRLRSDPLDIYGVRTAINNQRVPYVYDARNGFAPTITIDPRFNLDDWSLFSDDARLTREEEEKKDRIFATRFDASYALDGFINKVDAGLRYSRRRYTTYDDLVTIDQASLAVDRAVNLACRTNFPQSDYLADAPNNTIHSWATFDTLCQFRNYLGTEDPGGTGDTRSVANADVTETVWSGYVMASYKGEAAGMPVRGNFGVRVVDTSVVSKGLRAGLEVVNNSDGSIRLVETGEFDPTRIKASSFRVLPSVNANFDLNPKTIGRIALYRAMSRPAPSSLAAGRTITLQDGTDFTSIQEAIGEIVASGSPRLKPIMSWNADVALEYYYNRDTILATTLYYKQFTGGFIPVTIDEEFVIDGQNVTVPVTQTQNSDDKSHVYGAEFTLSNKFSWLPKPLDGFGGKLSYNYAITNFKNHDIRLGDVIDPDTGVVTEGMIPAAGLNGYSKHVLSAQLYYEAGPLTLQGIYRYRSRYYQDFVGGNAQLRYISGGDAFDFTAQYKLNKKVDIRLQGLNLFNEVKVDSMPIQGSTRNYQYFGPQFFASIRARF